MNQNDSLLTKNQKTGLTILGFSFLPYNIFMIEIINKKAFSFCDGKNSKSIKHNSGRINKVI